MIVFFDTVRRKQPVPKGGELIKIDWSTKKILKTVPIFPSQPDIPYDPNPRGNSRGGKGILVSKENLFVGTYHTILVFDHSLNEIKRISNNLCVNIHEMSFSKKNIWVSSTTIDCALLLTQEGKTIKSWWPREEPFLQKKFGLFPMEINKQADNRLKYIHADLGQKSSHTHLNAVTTFDDHTYVLLNRLGVIIQIKPVVQIILEDSRLRGAHSPAIFCEGKQMIVCSSFHKEILFYDLKNRTLIKKIHLLDFNEISNLHKKFPGQPFNQSIFVRGLDIIDDSRIFIGISPASILEIDISRNKLLDFYQYSNDVGDAVHGLVHLPADKK